MRRQFITPPVKSYPVRDSTALLLTHAVVWATIVAPIILASNRTELQRIGGAATGIVVILLVILRELDVRSGSRFTKLFMVLYLSGATLALTLLSMPADSLLLVWLMVTIFGYLHFGRRGVVVTSVFLVIAKVAKYWYGSSTRLFSFRETMFMIISFLLYLVLVTLYLKIQEIYDTEHARLKSTVRTAQIEQKRLKTLINNMTESVLVLDTNGKVRLYNAATLALFDTNTNPEGKQPEDFITLEDEKGKKVPVAELLPPQNQPVTRNDIILRYAEDDSAALSITVTPLRNSFGDTDEDTGYIMTMRDITREKSLEEERNEFISVISHELRTPVTVTEASISNAMMINEKAGGDAKAARALELAHDQAIFLANMLNDLSTFARAEKGSLELDLEPFNPRELVERLESDYRKEVEVKDMFIRSQVAEGTPEVLVSNRLYVREILQNFLTNAIKYSDKGTITVSCQPHENGVRFSVSDEGIGISKSDQKKVFDKFFRAEDYRTRSSNGTGLGLYIVKKLAKILQANFDLESEVGTGSTFSLDVPDLNDMLAKHHPQGGDGAETGDDDMHTPSAPAPVPAQTPATEPAESAGSVESIEPVDSKT